MSRAAIINFPDFYNKLKSNQIYAAIDVFPIEPVDKNDPIRKLRNVIFSAHRAGALNIVFKDMGKIVYEDMKLIQKRILRLLAPNNFDLCALGTAYQYNVFLHRLS